MDLSVIKEQLGHFKTFVENTGGLLKNLPEALFNIAGLVDGKLKLFGETSEYNESKDALKAAIAAAREKANSK